MEFVPDGVFQKAAIFNRKGEVLLLKASKKYGEKEGTWDLPGGKVEEGEGLEEAIRREVKEETGIVLKHLRVACADIATFYNGKRRVGIIYTARMSGKIRLANEHTMHEWVPVKKLAGRKFAFDNLPVWIKKAKGSIR